MLGAFPAMGPRGLAAVTGTLLTGVVVHTVWMHPCLLRLLFIGLFSVAALLGLFHRVVVR